MRDTYSIRPNPGDIAMQSNLICVPTLAIVKARPADQNGGYARSPW
jgi:hypothetical protein